MSLLPARSLGLALLSLAYGAAGAGCGSSSAGPVGGAVDGAVSTRCVDNGVVMKNQVGPCLTDVDAGADGGAAPSPGASDYGATLYNQSGYDDDCKYHVSWDSTPIRKNADVTFTVTVEGLDPAGPATGANIVPEVYLTAIHPAAGSSTTTETPPGSGVYKVGPIVFDASGVWTVRFHLYETCSDAPQDSPHGHIAFFVNVP
jgi:hypothetical protein